MPGTGTSLRAVCLSTPRQRASLRERSRVSQGEASTSAGLCVPLATQQP